MAAMPDSFAALPRRERLAKVIREYDAQGWHRTGTDCDAASARWLAELARACGCGEPALDPMPFERLEVLQCSVSLEDGEAEIEGVPIFDGAATGPEGVEGTFGVLGEQAEIPVVRWPPAIVNAEFYEKVLEMGKFKALVIVTGGSDFDLPEAAKANAGSYPEGYSLINAERFEKPFPKPVVQVPSTAAARLLRARQEKVRGRVTALSQRVTTQVYNVSATVLGRDPDAAPLVVMTPRSGWWQVASERGGGLALWMELLLALQQTRPRRSVHFVASTGHELGHIGLHHYLHEHESLIAGAHLWLHLGANIAAAVGRKVRLQASDEAWKDRALAAMAKQNVEPDVVVVGQRPMGEARDIHDGKGHFVSLLGANGLFHCPSDRFPESVDLAHTERVAEAFVAFMQEVAEE